MFRAASVRCGGYWTACRFDASHDVVMPTGDLVNKGPDSIGVLEFLRELDAKPVLGNHDLRWLETGRIRNRNLRQWLAEMPIVPDHGRSDPRARRPSSAVARG